MVFIIALLGNHMRETGFGLQALNHEALDKLPVGTSFDDGVVAVVGQVGR